MKKKIISIALVVAMIAIIAAGSFAYFTDKDAQTNTFTVGNVKIDLFEDFNTANLPLVPAVGKIDENGYAMFENKIEKEVYVENTGAEKAYVRVQIAVPMINNETIGENGEAIGWQAPIRLGWSEFTCHQGQWNWGTELAANDKPEGLINSGHQMNMYNVKIDGVWYCVYVGTYETALDPEEITLDAIDTVYMPPEITQEDIAYFDEHAPGWNNVYVVAEAVQIDGFDDAFTALNTAFGEPGKYTVDFKAESQGQIQVERTGAEGK